jgi:uncharacterized protein (DUF924 family)
VSTPVAPTPEPLLTFWFGALQDGFADHEHRQAWFTGGRAMDERVRALLADLPDAAAAGRLDGWLDSPRGRLAWIIACDQLPRHLYRGAAQAFAYDRLALAAARAGVEAGVDRALGADERAFFYLPFEHSESTVDQHTAVGLFTALRDGAPTEHRELAGSWLPHAIQHRDIILRFRRFPHRNAVLGRDSSAAEREHLATGSTFGQG